MYYMFARRTKMRVHVCPHVIQFLLFCNTFVFCFSNNEIETFCNQQDNSFYYTKNCHCYLIVRVGGRRGADKNWQESYDDCQTHMDGLSNTRSRLAHITNPEIYWELYSLPNNILEAWIGTRQKERGTTNIAGWRWVEEAEDYVKNFTWIPDVDFNEEDTDFCARFTDTYKLEDRDCIDDKMNKWVCEYLPADEPGNYYNSNCFKAETTVLTSTTSIMSTTQPIITSAVMGSVEIESSIRTTNSPNPLESKKPTTEQPTMSSTVEVPTMSSTVEVPTMSSTVEVPTMSSTVEVPTMSSTVEVPTMSSSVKVPTTVNNSFTENSTTQLTVKSTNLSKLPFASHTITQRNPLATYFQLVYTSTPNSMVKSTTEARTTESVVYRTLESKIIQLKIGQTTEAQPIKVTTLQLVDGSTPEGPMTRQTIKATAIQSTIEKTSSRSMSKTSTGSNAMQVTVEQSTEDKTTEEVVSPASKIAKNVPTSRQTSEARTSRLIFETTPETATTGSILESATSATATTGSKLESATSATATTGSILESATSATATTGSILESATSATATTGSILESATSATATTGSILESATSATATTGSRLESATSATATTGSILESVTTATATTESIFESVTSATATTESIFESVTSATATTGSMLESDNFETATSGSIPESITIEMATIGPVLELVSFAITTTGSVLEPFIIETATTVSVPESITLETATAGSILESIITETVRILTNIETTPGLNTQSMIEPTTTEQKTTRFKVEPTSTSIVNITTTKTTVIQQKSTEIPVMTQTGAESNKKSTNRLFIYATITQLMEQSDKSTSISSFEQPPTNNEPPKNLTSDTRMLQSTIKLITNAKTARSPIKPTTVYKTTKPGVKLATETRIDLTTVETARTTHSMTDLTTVTGTVQSTTITNTEARTTHSTVRLTNETRNTQSKTTPITESITTYSIIKTAETRITSLAENPNKKTSKNKPKIKPTTTMKASKWTLEASTETEPWTTQAILKPTTVRTTKLTAKTTEKRTIQSAIKSITGGTYTHTIKPSIEAESPMSAGEPTDAGITSQSPAPARLEKERSTLFQIEVNTAEEAQAKTTPDTGLRSTVITTAEKTSTKLRMGPKTTKVSTSPAPQLHMSPELVVAAEVVQSLGCIYIVGILSFTILIQLRNPMKLPVERIITGSQELSLLLAHLIILFHREPEATGIQILCKASAIGLHYFFTVCLLFYFLEGLQSYAVLTHVTLKGGYLTIRANLFIGWGLPALLVGIVAPVYYKNYTSYFSCWLNLEHTVSTVVLTSYAVIVAVTVVVWEATGMQTTGTKLLIQHPQTTSAIISVHGLPIQLGLLTSSTVIGMITVFHQRFALYTAVFVLNIALGTAVFIFHASQNEKVIKLVARLRKHTC